MSKGTLHDIFITTSEALTTGVMGEYIFWLSEHEMAMLADEVVDSTSFPVN